jgi:hypothetical protein
MLGKALIVFCSVLAIALASHDRYGTIHFTKTNGNARQVTFTFDASFRRTYFGSPNVGDTVYDADWDFGDGNYLQIPLLVTQIDTTLDLVVVKWVGSHTYGGSGDYTVGWISCCRIFALNNNPSYSYAHTALVHLTSDEVNGIVAPNNSPSSSFPPINTIPYNVVPYQYQITATDPEGDALTFVQATPGQQGDPSSTQPTGMSVSSNGIATLSSVLAHGYWTTQQIIHDNFGNWISLDYLLDVENPVLVCSGCAASSNPQCTTNADCSSFCVNSTCIQPEPRVITNSAAPAPYTNLPSPAAGAVYNIQVGDSITLNFVVDDDHLVHPAQGPTINFYTTPSGSTTSAQQECTAANGCTCTGCNDHAQFRTLSYTAPASAIGTGNVVCITANSYGNPLPAPNNPYCVTINVLAAPLTTQAITSQSLTTQPLTTSFLTVADRCATYSFPETQGFFCSADQAGYYQCLKGPWASQAVYHNCAPGTYCRCAQGVECSANGVCTF